MRWERHPTKIGVDLPVFLNAPDDSEAPSLSFFYVLVGIKAAASRIRMAMTSVPLPARPSIPVSLFRSLTFLIPFPSQR